MSEVIVATSSPAGDPSTSGEPATRGRRRQSIVALVLLSLSALILLARYHYAAGFWGEEPYGLSTALRYCLGDRPFVDSWDTNFSSAIMAMPFVRSWIAVTGSTEGILLGYRGLFYVLTVVTASTAYVVLKDVLAWWLALAMGILIMLYLPYLSPFGYGGDVQWHMLSALTAVWLLNRPREGIANTLPGVLSALGILANPSTVVVVPFFAVALWLAHRDNPDSASAKPFALYLAGVGAVVLVFLLVLRILSGPDLFASFESVTSPDDHDFGARAQLSRFWAGRWVIAVPLFFGILVGVLRRIGGERWNAWAVTTVLFCCLFVSLFAIATQRVLLLFGPQSLVFMVGAGLLLMFLVSGAPCLGWQWVLVLPALGAGIGWFLGSNGGVSTGVQAAPLILAAALAWWPQPDATSARGDSLAGALASALLAVVIAATAAFGMLWTPLGTVWPMTESVNRGPFKGIRTTPQDARVHARVYDTIRGLPRISGRIVFIERMPLGYLIADNPPGTYSTWLTASAGSRLNEYIARTGNRPSRVVLARFPGGPDGFPTSVSLDGFPEDYLPVYSDDDLRVYDVRTP